MSFLGKDLSFENNCEYLDKAYEPLPLNFTAPFRWGDTGNIIIMDPMDVLVQYKVTSTSLCILHQDGNYFDLAKIKWIVIY